MSDNGLPFRASLEDLLLRNAVVETASRRAQLWKDFVDSIEQQSWPQVTHIVRLLVKSTSSHEFVIFGLARVFLSLTEIEEPILERRFELVVRNPSQSGDAGFNSGMDLGIGSRDSRHKDTLLPGRYLSVILIIAQLVETRKSRTTRQKNGGPDADRSERSSRDQGEPAIQQTLRLTSNGPDRDAASRRRYNSRLRAR